MPTQILDRASDLLGRVKKLKWLPIRHWFDLRRLMQLSVRVRDPIDGERYIASLAALYTPTNEPEICSAKSLARLRGCARTFGRLMCFLISAPTSALSLYLPPSTSALGSCGYTLIDTHFAGKWIHLKERGRSLDELAFNALFEPEAWLRWACALGSRAAPCLMNVESSGASPVLAAAISSPCKTNSLTAAYRRHMPRYQGLSRLHLAHSRSA